MIGEIIAIGNELTSGRVLNTTSFFAANRLFTAGHEIVAMATVGDKPAMIAEALTKAIGRADFVIVTGGLGATSDDLTNETVAQTLQRPATFYPEILAEIKTLSTAEGRPADCLLEKLAWLPKGAEVLEPGARMAGYLLVHAEKPIFFLPGVPHEMRHLLAEKVIPRLAAWPGGGARKIAERSYKLFGIGETEVNEQLASLEKMDSRIRIGYYPVFPEVHLSAIAIAEEESEAARLIALADGEIRLRLGSYILACGDQTLEGEIGRLLSGRGEVLAIAESCTGGLVAARITKVAGSSRYFLGGVVAYSNDLKERLLSVPAATLRQHGAVSAETAAAMAEGVRHRTGADIGVAVTGIAGPSGGSSEKPVGTVYIAVADAAGTQAHHFLFTGHRWQIQELACQTALGLVQTRMQDRSH